MTNRRTFLAAAGAAVSCMALPLTAISGTPGPAAASAPSVGGRGSAEVEQWLLGKGGPTLTAADLQFIRSSQHPGRASVETCDAR